MPYYIGFISPLIMQVDVDKGNLPEFTKKPNVPPPVWYESLDYRESVCPREKQIFISKIF